MGADLERLSADQNRRAARACAGSEQNWADFSTTERNLAKLNPTRKSKQKELLQSARNTRHRSSAHSRKLNCNSIWDCRVSSSPFRRRFDSTCKTARQSAEFHFRFDRLPRRVMGRRKTPAAGKWRVAKTKQVHSAVRSNGFERRKGSERAIFKSALPSAPSAWSRARALGRRNRRIWRARVQLRVAGLVWFG